ncbi:putative acylesterase/phospholipase RssA [Mariniflexile fucanivorans]|uniref:Putative acylesterase/phospholipase RssA n=1 Tax=Mariniflexile fucanivorans TaxID=264023 RepID=A0A4R1RG34_9FLAO|nr:patatin-like phospholipase family protein [Mariniflexile fucanivorans]TCL64869.1 putative acylesterase/phospholipase RssA [Mariniflexile fucanivorans]
MRSYFFLFILLIFGNLLQIYSQEQKPKIALVLSGGGAKGLAHIPLLQTLDSLGIVPDLVVGNSMGSLVGGLYAMGYSGDSIAQIAKHAKWDKLIGGGISLRQVSVEEKTEYNQYMIGFDWVEGKLKASNYLINDQNIREFMSSLAYPVYNIENFDDLQIPFRAVATDIVNGKEVVFESGPLAFAMRASMSIPGVFSAVPYQETLLIDGGVLNNFPVDVAKKWGADIIIGSDVGSGMVSRDELDNISSLIFQAGMLTSNLKNPENRALCDILIDHTPNLSYTTGDFTKSQFIYNEGKIATHQNLNELIALEKQVKKYTQLKHELPIVNNEVVLDTIVYTGISKTNLALVKARTNIEAHKPYLTAEILEGLNRAMGTTIFKQITFEALNIDDKLGLQLNGFERSKHQIKGSIHYDGYNGVGLIFNYTARNLIGNASRSLVTIDIAEQPKFRFQHQKNFGSTRNWWWRTELYGQQLKQKVFLNGEYVDDMRYRYINFDNQVNRNLGSLKSYVGIGLKYQNTNLKPTIEPQLNDNVFGLAKYNFNDTELYGQFQYNSMNESFFATRGSLFHAFLGRPLQINLKVKSSDVDVPTINGSTNKFTKFGIDFERRLLITKSKTAIIGVSSHFIVEDKLQDDDVAFTDYGVGAKYFLGGNILNPRIDGFVFPGIIENELNVSQFVKLNLAFQMNTGNKIFVTPHIDMASVGFKDFDDFTKNVLIPKGKWQNSIDTSFLMSAGTTFSYNSLLGPINFDVSWVNNTNKVRFFIGIGYHFNRSN